MTTPQKKVPAAVKAQAEVANLERSFEFRGKTFSVLPVEELPILEIGLAQEEEKPLTMIKLLLGDEQWKELVELKLTASDLQEFSDALEAAQKGSPGE